MEYLLNGMSSWIQQNKIILLFSLLVIFLLRIFQIHFHKENNFWIFLEYLLNTHSISFLSLFYFLFQKHHHHIFCFLLFFKLESFFSHLLQKFRDIDVFGLFLSFYFGKILIFIIKKNCQFLFS